MLATHRCDEFIETCFSNFTQSMQPIREQLEGKQELVEGFGAKVGGMMEEVLTKYDAQAKRYNAAIATKKRDNLVEKMSDFGGSSFRLQVIFALFFYYYFLSSFSLFLSLFLFFPSLISFIRSNC